MKWQRRRGSGNAEFASVVLADTEDVWRQRFRDEFGRTYQEPRMVLFTG